MTVEPRRREIKETIARTFLDLGIRPQAISELKEAAFIEGGRCIACCVRVEELKAVWCVDDEIVNFFDAQGKLLKTVTLEPQPMKKAA
jgi:hypothetical protein